MADYRGAFVSRAPRGYRLTRWLSRWRRLIAGSCAVLAMASALVALRPAAGHHGAEVVEVVVAAQDLSGLDPVVATDITTREVPREHAPAGTLTSTDRVTGGLLTGPVHDGEVLTSARLAEPITAEYGPDTVARPVRVADAGAAGLVEPGSRIDILGTAGPAGPEFEGAGPAEVVVTDRPVLAVPEQEASVADSGALLLVVVSEEEAQALAGYGATGQLSIAIRS